MGNPLVDFWRTETNVTANEDTFTWQIVAIHDRNDWKIMRVVGHIDVPGQRTVEGGSSCENCR